MHPSRPDPLLRLRPAEAPVVVTGWAQVDTVGLQLEESEEREAGRREKDALPDRPGQNAEALGLVLAPSPMASLHHDGQD